MQKMEVSDACLPVATHPVDLLAHSIHNAHYWYGPREISRFVSDGRGEPLEFETIKEAHEWLKRANSGIYHLAHGEYARPSYKVVTAD
jgi:hypothetical protein